MTLRRFLLVLILFLYLLAIPWYRTLDSEPAIWLGLPDWTAVALVCFVGVAVANALAWLLTDIPDEPPNDRGQHD